LALATTQLELGFGSGVMFAQRTDIANATPVPFGALQDATISFNGELKDLFSQGQFPIAVARGKTKIEVKAKYALVSTPLYNTLFFGQTVTAGQVLASYAESHVVPTAGTVTVAQHSHFADDLGVLDSSSGQQLQYNPASGTPATGQYKYAAGVYTFATAQHGDTVLISYDYTVAGTGWTLAGANPFMGTTPIFRATFYQTFQNNSIKLVLYNCVGTTLTIPTGGVDNFMINDIAFSAFAGADGSVFELSTNQ
jgi:hypothetical protein